MTSKLSSNNPLNFTFKLGFRSLTTLIAFILCGGISFCTVLYTVKELFGTTPVYDDNGNIAEHVATRNQYHFLIFRDAEYMSTFLILIVALCGVMAAICTFNFITSKKMVNVYYSLGITRTKLFCGKYASGIVLLFIAATIPMIITFLVNILTVGYSLSLLKAVLYYTLCLFIIAATSFTITSAVFSAVGTTFETAIFSAIILFLPDIFLFSIQILMDMFLYGTPYGHYFMLANAFDYGSGDSVATLPAQLNYLSPVFWGKEQLTLLAVCKNETSAKTVPVVSPDFLTAILWLVITTVVFLLAVLIFNKRKAEISGFIGTNRVLNTFVSSLAGFAAFCYTIYNLNDMITGLIAGSLIFTAVHLILEAIVLRDMKKLAKGLYKLPIGIAVSVAITLIFNNGFFGFAQKIPEISEIESVSVTTVGTNAEYGLFSESWMYANYDVGFFRAPEVLVGEYKTANDMQAVIDVHQSIIQTEEKSRTFENNVQFVYKLKNGKTLKRNFNNISPETYKKILYLEDCDFYNETLHELFKGEIKKYNIYEQSPRTVFADAQKNLRNNFYVDFYSKYADKVFKVTLSETDRQKLLDALLKDITERSVKEKYYPETSPVGFIYFSYGSEEFDVQSAPEKTEFYEDIFSAKYSEFLQSSQWAPYFNTHITSDMTNTITFLKETGLYEKMISVPEFVSAEVIPADIAFEHYVGESDYILPSMSRCFVTKYSSVNSTIKQEGDYQQYEKTLDSIADGKIYTEKTEIAELLANSYTIYEQDDFDKGWFVSFKTASGDTSLCYIPEGKLPV